MTKVVQILWYLTFLINLAVLFKLIYLKLHRTYRFLYFNFLTLAVATIITFPVFHFPVYRFYYMATESLNLAMAISVVWELYEKALAGQSALATFGRKMVIYVSGVAVVLSILAIGIDSVRRADHLWSIQQFIRLERTLDLMIVVFLLLLSGFLIWFPIKLKRNIKIYIVGYVILFASRAIGLAVYNLLPAPSYRAIDAAILSFGLASMLFWLIALRAENEEEFTTMVHPTNPATLDRLSAQLDAINAALVRYSRS